MILATMINLSTKKNIIVPNIIPWMMNSANKTAKKMPMILRYFMLDNFL